MAHKRLVIATSPRLTVWYYFYFSPTRIFDGGGISPAFDASVSVSKRSRPLAMASSNVFPYVVGIPTLFSQAGNLT